MVAAAYSSVFADVGSPVSAAPIPTRSVPLQTITGLTIDGPSVISELNARAVRDFGTVDPLSVSDLRQDFILHNTAAAPLTITAIRPSCRCTTVTVGGATTGSGFTGVLASTAVTDISPLVIATGDRVILHVNVSLSDALPGQFDKDVVLTTSLPAGAQPELFMRFKVEPNVIFQPQVVNFGRVSVGHAPFLSVLVDFDERLLAGNPLPPLVASNPYVIVAEGPKVIEQSPRGTERPMQAQAYTVSISPNAPIGPIRTMLSFDTGGLPRRNSATSVKSTVNTSTSMWTISNAVVVANVVGDAAAVPSSVSYGMVNPALHPVKIVDLIGTANALHGAIATANTTWFTVTMGDMRQTPPTAIESGSVIGDYERPLTITLGMYSSSGVLVGNVVVHLSNGQAMTIPVSVYIPPASVR